MHVGLNQIQNTWVPEWSKDTIFNVLVFLIALLSFFEFMLETSPPHIAMNIVIMACCQLFQLMFIFSS
jgi:hypothetical protein